MRASEADLSQEGAPGWPAACTGAPGRCAFAEALLDPRHGILNPQRPLWLLLRCEEGGIGPWSNHLTACGATDPLNPHVWKQMKQLQSK